ncbi:MAG TPA: DUF2298 domain-containing protein [Aggregatilineales bacterium]|nr:DUF2298 domain-containing protein [Aggregatilineales bacterium]
MLSYQSNTDSLPTESSNARSAALRRNGITVVVLLIVYAFAIYFRFVGQNWDDFTHLHPDERFLTQVAEAMNGPLRMTDTSASVQMQECLAQYPETNGIGGFFDSKCTNWYPKNVGHGLYVYGELPLFVVRIAAEITQIVHADQALATADPNDDIIAANWTGYNGIHLVGRTVSAVTDLLAMGVIFLIGCRLFGRWVGLLTITLYAGAVLPIQLAHFWTTDAFTTLPVVLTMYFAIRIRERGRYSDFIWAGVFMGCALASRINTLPFAAIIVLAAAIYALPGWDRRLVWRERNRLFSRAVLGVLVAGLFTVFTFRFTNPHAFTGGSGILGVFNLINFDPESPKALLEQSTGMGGFGARLLRIFLYDPFVDDIFQSQFLVSGQADSPPNHQWASRTPYLFAAQNITVWGLGLPLGLMGWIGFGWACWRVLRARRDWSLLILPAAWVLLYFGYMGRLWVMTMRYYMPLYPFLIMLAAWAMVELVKERAALTALREGVQRLLRPRLARRLGVALLVGIVAFTYLWAGMFTNIYRHQLTRVQASNWFFQEVPSAVSLPITYDSGEARQLFVPIYGSRPDLNYTPYEAGKRRTLSIVTAGNERLDRVLVQGITDPEKSGRAKTFWVGIARDQDGLNVVSTGRITADFGKDGTFGSPYTVLLDPPLTLTVGEPFYLVTWADEPLAVTRAAGVAGEFILASADVPSIAVLNLPPAIDLEAGQASAFVGQEGVSGIVDVPAAGNIDQVTLAHVLNPLDGGAVSLKVSLLDGTSAAELATGILTVAAPSSTDAPFGAAQTIQLDRTVSVREGQTLRVAVQTTDSGIARLTGTVIAVEGPWDDPVPTKTCALPPLMDWSEATPGMIPLDRCSGRDPYGTLYRGIELYLSLEDDAGKRDIMLNVLNDADYLTISSNRFYDSLSRIPIRFPMSLAYYKALFSGELGFDLVKVFNTSYGIAGIDISDQHLPFYNSPAWLNEYEAEEAFHVYDHPAVLVFRKNTERYSAEKAAAILGAVSLADNNQFSGAIEDTNILNIVRWGALPATKAPSGLRMDDTLRAIQSEGGTWAALFPKDSFVNSSQLITVIVWYLLILIIGWAAFPLLYALLPGLPDRGYPMAKTAGLLIIAWVAWAGGALRFLTWSAWGLLFITLALIGIGAWAVYRHWGTFLPYVRRNFRHFLIVEGIFLALFIGFLLVRFSTPDLWAQSLGGEKPMNFAYFNAVLKSTVFPPYDPWFAGGYLNYYYFGYVFIGVPTKLLGILPNIAFNLAVITFFALTGIGAFSIAFNLAAARWFRKHEPDSDAPHAPTQERRRFALRLPAASPYLAGSLALLLCVVLGNLGTPTVIASGIARAGGCGLLPTDMFSSLVDAYKRENNGADPDGDALVGLVERSQNPSLSDRLTFWVESTRGSIECMARGVSLTISSGYIPTVGPDRWFWGPRSIVGEYTIYGNEINEFPYFTFIFGDLHAHMMALPITLLVIGWLLAEILIAGTRRATWVVIGATILGGLSIGILQATNTWDWITYLIVGMVGTLYAIFLRRHALNLRHVVGWGAQLGGLYLAQSIAMLPFTAFFATAYSSVKSFEGLKTPLWAYFTMHGVFLFIVISLFVWQTARLLRHLYLRDLVGKAALVRGGLLIIGLSLIAAAAIAILPIKVFLFSLPIPLGVLLIPLIIWCAVLLLLPDQPREMAFVYGMFGLALALSFAVEVVVLDGDIARQNTFFKFYMQVWIMFSIGGGAALAWLISASRRWEGGVRLGWLLFAGLLLGTAALFPITATQGKIAMRMATDAPNTLDGNAFMEYATYYEGSEGVFLGNDLKMIEWLRDNVTGTPVILEAHQYPSEYKLNGRIAINTGLPSLLGWRFHQQQQRTLDPLPTLVQQRGANVIALYNTPDAEVAWRMLQTFNVRYIIVGRLEPFARAGKI